MKANLNLLQALTNTLNFVSAGTISQMELSKNTEITIKSDGYKVFLDTKERENHFPIKVEKKPKVRT